MRSSKKQGLGIREWGFVCAVYVVLTLRAGAIAQPHTFGEVASGLQHPDASTRLRAIQILKDADYPEAAAPIAAVLEDADDRVQLAAIDALRSLFTTRSVPRRKKVALVIEVRTVAGGESAAAGQLALKPRAVPAQVLGRLPAALRDRTPGVRAEAISLAALLAPVTCASRGGNVRGQADPDACSQIGNALIDNINSRESTLRRVAMQALGQLGYANAVQALSDQFSYYQKGPDALAALEGLAGVGHSMSASLFQELLTSSNADMRRLSVEGLARAGERDALPRLQQMGQTERAAGVLLALHYANAKLGDNDSSLQQLVASLASEQQRPIALGYVLDLSASYAPRLAGALKDPSVDVRRLVADAIGFSRNPAVIPALEAAAQDSDPDVADAARNAITRLKL